LCGQGLGGVQVRQVHAWVYSALSATSSAG